ncbi:MAG: MFS transporter, partial [Candidatus Eisenbacteria bacterium]|nr:MFS transporter [Candidatus Eisenbacteria bacterium]
MRAVRDVFTDFLDAARHFSRPARFYLFAEFLIWTAHGVYSVLFNLYLVEAGYPESFVGRAISVNAIGLAVAALPAGFLAERWGRRKSLVLGAVLEGIGHVLRASTAHGATILATGFIVGVGQAFFQIAAAPFLSEHSTPRERTHLFSTFFAAALIAGVIGSAFGGVLPKAVQMVWPHTTLFVAYRITLLAAAALAMFSLVPLFRMGRLDEKPLDHEEAKVTPQQARHLFPIALNALLIGMG